MPEPPEFAALRTRYNQAIGNALSQFSMVEHWVGRIFCLAIGARDSEAAYRAFWTVIAFIGRLKLANAAVRYELRDDQAALEKWKALYSLLEQEASKRNQIAHGTLVVRLGNNSHDLSFFPYMFKDVNAAEGNRLSVEAVEAMAGAFAKAHDTASEFYRDMLLKMVGAGKAQLGPSEQHMAAPAASPSGT